MDRRQEKWHVGKEIPIALIIALSVQTGGMIWWAATQTAKLDNLVNMVAQFQANQYTKHDAAKDVQFLMSRISDNERRIDKLENRSGGK